MFESKYPHLFSPITIKNTTFKNRIIIGPAGMNHIFTTDQLPRHDCAVSFGARARSGAAAVTLNETMNDLL